MIRHGGPKIPFVPLFMPQSLLEKRIECPVCKQLAPIPFKRPQKEVIEPVTPLDFHPVTNNKHWVCIATTVPCEGCGAGIQVPLPTVTQKTEVHLFADEAARTVDGRNVWVFAAIGSDKRLLPGIEAKVRAVKARLIPGRAPTDWTMHMKDLWAGDARTRHPVFSSLTRDQVAGHVSEVAALLREASRELFTFVCVVSRPAREPVNEPMKLSFSVLFHEIIHGFTEGGSAPVLHLDAQRPASIQSQAVGWIDGILTELRHTLGYAFLTHGIAIPKPRIIAPGSAACAELADFVAFWIARLHERKWRGLEVELDPAQFGPVFYMVERAPDEIVRTRQVQFPWSLCYEKPLAP
jgi:hypothetical protein